MSMKYIRLGDVLIKSGAITPEQLDEALAMQKTTGQRLGTVLIDSGIIKESQLINALTTQLGVEYIDLSTVTIPADMARILPRSIAKKYTVVEIYISSASSNALCSCCAYGAASGICFSGSITSSIALQRT